MRCQGVENEFVAINRKALPANPYDLTTFLKMEFAPRSCWRDVASAYFENEQLEAGIRILEEATSDEVNTALKDTVAEEPCSRLDLLIALGGAYLIQAEKLLHDPSAREKALDKAKSCIQRADKIDIDEPSIWVVRAWREFALGKIASAKEWFDNAHNKNFVLGSLGLAALLLNRPRDDKDLSVKTDPIAIIINALRTGACPPSAWTALGHALYRDRRYKEARDVACRALTAVASGPHEERLEALYLITLVESCERTKDGIVNMSAALREAYVSCGGHNDPRILSLLADMYFNGGDFKEAAKFGVQAVSKAKELPSSEAGMHASVQRELLVTALFQHGRATHHLGNLELALDIFDQIKTILDTPEGANIVVNPGFYFRYGMLKLSTGRKEDEKMAHDCLEKVLKNKVERTFAAMRAMGFLLGRRYLLNMRRGKPRGGELYKRAIELLKTGLSEVEGMNDIPAQLMYAALMEESYPDISLRCYETVIKTATERKLELDVEVWVNYAAILTRKGKAEEAKKLMEEKVPEGDECSTVWYNKGRLAEILREEEDAVTNFKKIQESEPHYPEAQVRLGVIAANRGNMDEAEGLLKASMKNPTTRAVAAAHLANLYGSQTENKKAQAVLEQHRNDCDYLSLAFSKFIYKWLPANDEARRWRFLTNHIAAPVFSLMKHNKHNSYAANVAGLFFTEMKEVDNARDAFTAAGTQKSESIAALTNLAHTEVVKGRAMSRNMYDNIGRINKSVLAGAKTQFEKAERLYKTVLETGASHTSAEAFQESLETSHYLGCAQYEARDFQAARLSFSRVLRHEPASWATWYNLGITLFECAQYRIYHHVKILKEMQEAKKEFQSAMRALKQADFLGRAARGRDPVVHTRPDRELYGLWYQFIKQELKRHGVNIVNAKTEDEDRKKRELEREAHMAEVLRKREEEKRAKEAAERKELESLQEAARKAAEKLAMIEKRNAEEKAAKEKREKEDYITDDEGEEPQQEKKQRKRKRKPQVDDDSDEENAKPKRAGAKARRKRVVQKVADESSDEYASDIDKLDFSAPPHGKKEYDEKEPKKPRLDNTPSPGGADEEADGAKENGVTPME